MPTISDGNKQQVLNTGETPSARTTLDPTDWSAFRAQAHRMLDDMLDYTAGIREHPVWQTIPAEVRMRFHQQLPLEPTSLEQVHYEFMSSILPFTARNGHPGFMGWVQGGGTPVGMLAEMLAAGLNANLGGRDQIPLEVERQVSEWMRTLFDFPAGATGLFVTGTSMANFLAVKVARDARLGCEVRRQGMRPSAQTLVAYASTAVHGCIGQALDLAGLGSGSLRLIAVDSRHRIDLHALAAAVSEDEAAGLTPFFVVGTAGTVDTGAIDDLDGVATFCAQHELWFHVDGACGALAMLASDVAPRLRGIERADSLAFDFHKWAQVPYDAGFLLVRDGAKHRQAFTASCAYLSRAERGMAAGSPWPCDFGPDLSRGFRALKTWATLKVYGTRALGAVISHTCALARLLESRIIASAELELMAPVELNIVCFRYRFAATADRANHLNGQIVVLLQEAGAVAPSTTRIGNRLAIRAAIVNHRTTEAEINALIDAVLAAGRSLRPPIASAMTGEEPSSQWVMRNQALAKMDAQLTATPSLPTKAEVELRYRRARLLTELGRSLEARNEHIHVVKLDPAHERNLNSLGLLLVATGNRNAARITFGEVVKHHPESAASRVNFGAVLLEDDDPTAAREQYETALRLDPSSQQAHAGLYYALKKLGELESAEQHRRLGFAQNYVFTNPYRGASTPIPLLLLVASAGGNTPIEKLLDDTVFEVHIIVADFYDLKNPLPAHSFIVNGIGDADVAQDALDAAELILAHTSAPVLNAPAAVKATGRSENAARQRNLPGVVVPAIESFPYALLAASDGAGLLAHHGFSFPLLLRVPGFHMGEHFVQVESAAGLPAALAELPGAGRQAAQLLAIEYLDARGADGHFRKYRVMMIDGQLYPLHLAISSHWKIHYFSADMADKPEHRIEEARFLADMPGAMGGKALAALARLQAALKLDYGGVDFGLTRQGEILLFEANATMVVQQPAEGELWDYRRAAVDRIHTAVRDMLMRNELGCPIAHDRPFVGKYEKNADIAR